MNEWLYVSRISGAAAMAALEANWVIEALAQYDHRPSKCDAEITREDLERASRHITDLEAEVRLIKEAVRNMEKYMDNPEHVPFRKAFARLTQARKDDDWESINLAQQDIKRIRSERNG